MNAVPERNSARFAPANRRRLSGPGFRTFIAITDLWELTDDQRRLVIGYPSRATYRNWLKRAGEHRAFTLGVDTLTRISAVLRIHQRLGAMFSTEQLGVAWLRAPNNAIIFGRHPPIGVVTCGSLDGLLTVCRFLDSVIGGTQSSGPDEGLTLYGDSEIIIR
jgi:hypothetical protein